MLRVANVSKAYGGLQALSDVSLRVSAGEVVALLGPNGAGKSTLLSIIAGLRQPDAGSVAVAGFDVRDHAAMARAELGLAPQELGLYYTLTVRENLDAFAGFCGLAKSARRRRSEELIELFELGEFADRKAGTLSGGEGRRLHTAIALINEPSLLLLDEPTVGADIASRGRILQAVKQLAADGAAVVYTTHYMPEIEELDARVVIIDGGRLLVDGSVAELLEAHAHVTAELIFDGPAPALTPSNSAGHDLQVEVDGSVLRLLGRDAAAAVGPALVAIGDKANRLSSVELHKPNLEAVFLSVTGRSLLGTGDEEEA